MEYLSRCLDEVKDNGRFKFHPKCAKLRIKHLCFADDLLLFCRGDQHSIGTIYQCFHKFSLASGLQANMNKSSIYFGGVTDQMKETILHQFQFNYGEFPFKYLGIPLSTKKLSLTQWTPLVNKIVARITSWTAKKLSYAGRKQLVQSVLFGIQAYWSQLFIIPTKVLKLIEAYCRSFIWSGTNTITKRALIAWEKIWIHSYYIKSHTVFNVPIPQQASWMVKKILAARVILEQIHTQRDSPTTANFYVHLLGNRPIAPWKNMMFNNSARPKAIVTMWIMLQNKLPTTDRLTSWGMNVNQQCKLCQQDLENREHLFT
ncbi:uncharacterized protein LOC129894035 [Solanum dulcamara]|uniref:uncharacterized protein LOC129894035 n=1 Tax=Solanum dulcamara TaxID=45834 RepID=UPI00248526C0|nr:uncharacterized protein LOC129894035 [Solanum dulcamara]